MRILSALMLLCSLFMAQAAWSDTTYEYWHATSNYGYEKAAPDCGPYMPPHLDIDEYGYGSENVFQSCNLVNVDDIDYMMLSYKTRGWCCGSHYPNNPQPWQFVGYQVGSALYCNGNASLQFPNTGGYAICNRAGVSPKDSGPQGCPCNSAGEPISAGTGNKYEVIDDIVAVGPSPLKFTRYYNSLVYSSPASVFGGSWSSNYDRSIVRTTPDGILSGVPNYNPLCSPTWDVKCVAPNDIAPPSVAALIMRPDGKSFQFNWSGGQWVSDGDVVGRLTSSLDSSGNIIGYTYINEQDETETYNGYGQLLTITNRAGITQTINYASTPTIAVGAGAIPYQIASISDSFGRQLTFTYNSSGRLATVTDPNGGIWTYTYDSSNNNLITVTEPDSTATLTKQYAYTNTNFPTFLTGVIDEKGNTIDSTAYDNTTGQAILSVGALGTQSTSLSFGTGTPQVTTVTTPLGETLAMTETTVLGVYKVASIARTGGGVSHGTESYTYDAYGNLSSKTDYNGVVTNYTYDTTRNLETSRTEAYGTPRARTITTAWSTTFRLPTLITEKDASGTTQRTTAYSYDSNGNLLGKVVTDVVNSLSQTWGWTYNSYGQVLTATDPLSHTTTYTYSSSGNGNLATVTNALGQVTQYTSYNGSGMPLTIVDPNGVTTTRTYDAHNRVTSSTAAGHVTSFVYDAAGLLSTVTLPDGNVITYSYDAAQRLVEIDDKAGNKKIYALDNAGNRLKESVTDTGGLSAALDLIQRLIRLGHPQPQPV